MHTPVGSSHGISFFFIPRMARVSKKSDIFCICIPFFCLPFKAQKNPRDLRKPLPPYRPDFVPVINAASDFFFFLCYLFRSNVKEKMSNPGICDFFECKSATQNA